MSKTAKRGAKKVERGLEELREQPNRNQTGERNLNTGQLKQSREVQGGGGGGNGGGGGKKRPGETRRERMDE